MDLLLHEQPLLLLLMLQSILLLHHQLLLLLLLPLMVLLHTRGHLPLHLPWWPPKGGTDGLSRRRVVTACHA